ncbi:pantoate--beta-alanine ligase [Herbiconiux sp. L3-i23]|uniref:pantoate--beta-alanine ligase n=1 Tax=Herbiconiux sp. L3-i23 TaxID=2905871 RepID=UPI002052A07F|nr:pantoate--beta-alanine ligase [Herbiconiux sp. L3-i23]BDI23965.1 pantothenate synthetase [Herbiconiux sp. L3-i23]
MTQPIVEHTIAGIRERVRSARAEIETGGAPRARVALVPTMGALHAGHLALVERAREVADIVVVSVFVNPLQFGEKADLEAYPRTLDSDVELLGSVADGLFVFAPSGEEMYPNGFPATRVSGGAIADRFEGRSRRGHFDGVLTVVSKLFHIVGPDVAVFGRKDAQQAFLVERMVRDLDFPITIETVEIVREDDGLARSSRNRRLGSGERIAALALSRALEAAASSADAGIDAAIAAAQSALMGERLVTLDYLAIVDPTTFTPVDDGHRGRALVLIAADVGGTRLIDNESIYLR